MPPLAGLFPTSWWSALSGQAQLVRLGCTTSLLMASFGRCPVDGLAGKASLTFTVRQGSFTS
jgi:hypothetical protein